jgi:hypothetical protein
MVTILGACLAAAFLTSGNVYAQIPPSPDRGVGVSDAGLRRVSRQLFHQPAMGARLSLERLPAPAIVRSTTRATQFGARARTSPSRRGALIGLLVGTAAAAVYWTGSGCSGGSDSSSAMVTHCVVPTGAMIAGGWFIGRSLGR